MLRGTAAWPLHKGQACTLQLGLEQPAVCEFCRLTENVPCPWWLR